MNQMFISVQQNPGYAATLWIPETAYKFVDQVKNDKISFSMDLCDAGYFCTQPGLFGWCGPYVPDRKRDPFKKKFLVLSMRFIVAEDWVTSHKESLDSLIITPGGLGQKMCPVHSRPICDSKTVDVDMGLYKTPLFYKVYPLFREVYPNMTELEMASYGVDNGDYSCDKDECYHCNSDFAVKRVYNGEEGCLYKYTQHNKESVPTGKSTVTLNIFVTDLEANTPTLLKILSSV